MDVELESEVPMLHHNERKIPHETQFLSVEYPGNVLNVQNAINTLGGIETITKVWNDISILFDLLTSKAQSEKASVLRLNFSPSEWNSHPIYGDRVPSAKLLLKVRTSKAISSEIVENEQQRTVEHEIMGVIPSTYKFRGVPN
jgi:hypothetical protein